MSVELSVVRRRRRRRQRQWQKKNQNYVFLCVWSQLPLTTAIALFLSSLVQFFLLFISHCHLFDPSLQSECGTFISQRYAQTHTQHIHSPHILFARSSKMPRYHRPYVIISSIHFGALILFLHLFCFIIIAILSSNLWKLCYWNENVWPT